MIIARRAACHVSLAYRQAACCRSAAASHGRRSAVATASWAAALPTERRAPSVGTVATSQAFSPLAASAFWLPSHVPGLARFGLSRLFPPHRFTPEPPPSLPPGLLNPSPPTC